jgi:hypothetical protein
LPSSREASTDVTYSIFASEQLSRHDLSNYLIVRQFRVLARDTYKADDRIAETIARSLCFNEPRILKLVDDDQRLYLVTKLLLGHHLFFPHSPEALTAITLLGKDPNRDILIPHGWEPFARYQSNSTCIEQCIKNLVSDLALLVKAFVRWDRPESLERVSERDLEKEIRRLIREALALLCGDLKWADNGELSRLRCYSSLATFFCPHFRKRRPVGRSTGRGLTFKIVHQLRGRSLTGVRLATLRYLQDLAHPF